MTTIPETERPATPLTEADAVRLVPVLEQPWDDYVLDPGFDLNFQYSCSWCGGEVDLDARTATHTEREDAKECWQRRYPRPA